MTGDRTRDDARPALRRLADHAGILPDYEAIDGSTRHASDEARERLLAALGYGVGDDAAADRALDQVMDAERARPVAPARVAGAEDAARVPLALADGAGQAVEWHAALTREDGTRHEASGRTTLDDAGAGAADLAVDAAELLPLGYHHLHVTVRGAAGSWHLGERAATQALVVAPARCADPAALLGGERVAGITANLYAVRGRRNWGAGDLTDLHTLAELAAANGAAFVGVNPLHALRTGGDDASPYSPASRRYRHLLYLDAEAVPELADSAEARALLADPAHAASLAALRARDQVDHRGVLAAKRPVLEALHRAFRARPADDPRRRAYDAYARREGAALDRWALFAALDEQFRAQGLGWWPEWPTEYNDAAGSAVAAFEAAHREAVDFHRWVQFELDRQLAEAAARGRALGLPVGLYQDLAVGASPAGADAWADPALYVRGVSIGAPPDPLGPGGQNWGLPPWNPRVLAERGYRDWAELARAAMAHAGALRIDHAIGLFRQFWIADGLSGADGAYVRFPAEALLGVLALESVRANGGAGALVVGEDLGTVPPEVRPTLARRGVLSSRVMYFERGEGGAFTPPRTYARAALATVNTHDLAPLAGWWAGRDVELRHAVGVLDDAAVADARAERGRERAQLVRLLHDEGVLDTSALGRDTETDSAGDALGETPDDASAADGLVAAGEPLGASVRGGTGPADDGRPPDAGAARRTDEAAGDMPNVDRGSPDTAAAHADAGSDGPALHPPASRLPPTLDADAFDEAAVRRAVHTVLRRAPSWLVGLALEDLVGEPEPVNMPGVGSDRFSSWTRRLRVDVEGLAGDPNVAAAFGAERVDVTVAGRNAPPAVVDDLTPPAG